MSGQALNSKRRGGALTLAFALGGGPESSRQDRSGPRVLSAPGTARAYRPACRGAVRRAVAPRKRVHEVGKVG